MKSKRKKIACDNCGRNEEQVGLNLDAFIHGGKLKCVDKNDCRKTQKKEKKMNTNITGTDKQIEFAEDIISKERKNINNIINKEKGRLGELMSDCKCKCCIKKVKDKIGRATKIFHAINNFSGHASHVIVANEIGSLYKYINNSPIQDGCIPLVIKLIIDNCKETYDKCFPN